jgi:hypothetical protein
VELLTARRIAQRAGHLPGEAKAAVALGERAVVLVAQQAQDPFRRELALQNVCIARSADFDLPAGDSRVEARVVASEPGDNGCEIVAVAQVKDFVSSPQAFAKEPDAQSLTVISVGETAARVLARSDWHGHLGGA